MAFSLCFRPRRFITPGESYPLAFAFISMSVSPNGARTRTHTNPTSDYPWMQRERQQCKAEYNNRNNLFLLPLKSLGLVTFLMFLRKVSYAYHGCIFLNQTYSRNSDVKYYTLK